MIDTGSQPSVVFGQQICSETFHKNPSLTLIIAIINFYFLIKFNQYVSVIGNCFQSKFNQ